MPDPPSMTFALASPVSVSWYAEPVTFSKALNVSLAASPPDAVPAPRSIVTAVAEADPVFMAAAARPIRAIAVESDGWAIAECNGIYFTVNSKGEAHPIKFPSDEISAAKGETLLRSPG